MQCVKYSKLSISKDLGPIPKSAFSEGSLQSRALDVSEIILTLVHCFCKMTVAVHFESRKLNEAELNYHPGETELLAVVHALKIWRCYLEGNPDVVVVTDHNSLMRLQTQSNLSPKQVRWMVYWHRFPFT